MLPNLTWLIRKSHLDGFDTYYLTQTRLKKQFGKYNSDLASVFPPVFYSCIWWLGSKFVCWWRRLLWNILFLPHLPESRRRIGGKFRVGMWRPNGWFRVDCTVIEDPRSYRKVGHTGSQSVLSVLHSRMNATFPHMYTSVIKQVLIKQSVHK